MNIQYVAGFLDGEGCFYVSPSGSFTIGVTSTYPRTLFELAEAYGGSVNVKKQKVGRPAFQWRVHGRLAIELADEIVDHLQEKKEQAELILTLYNVTAKGTALRDQLVTELKAMKRIHHAL